MGIRQGPREVTKSIVSRAALERPAREGESPVNERCVTSGRYLSTTGHVKPRGNLGRPLPKAKYP